jgi:hypothetical protein
MYLASALPVPERSVRSRDADRDLHAIGNCQTTRERTRANGLPSRHRTKHAASLAVAWER